MFMFVLVINYCGGIIVILLVAVQVIVWIIAGVIITIIILVYLGAILPSEGEACVCMTMYSKYMHSVDDVLGNC